MVDSFLRNEPHLDRGRRGVADTHPESRGFTVGPEPEQSAAAGTHDQGKADQKGAQTPQVGLE
jgi:hypothetical protein